MAGHEDKLELVPKRSVEIRETRTRRIAFKHDVFGRDWARSAFVAENMETSGAHVFGDVIFRSEPVAVEGRKRVSRRR
jgi:hypothetical protein